MLTKGVFGVKEAPRLWWLKFARTLEDCGWKPLRTVPGVFTIHEGGILKGMLAVHVDDGIWAGTGPLYEKARAKVREKLNVKKEATSDFNFLGRHVTQKDDGTIILDQHDFIGKIVKIER